MKPTGRSNKQWMQALGRRIATKRAERNLSQHALASHADIDRSQIAEIELGKSEAKIGTLRAIARGLGTTVSELLKDIKDFD